MSEFLFLLLTNLYRLFYFEKWTKGKCVHISQEEFKIYDFFLARYRL